MGVQDEGVLDKGIQDEGIRTREFRWTGRKEQERKEEITDRGNVGGYHDGNPIYRAMCIIWFGTRTTPDYDALKDEGRTAEVNIRSKYL